MCVGVMFELIRQRVITVTSFFASAFVFVCESMPVEHSHKTGIKPGTLEVVSMKVKVGTIVLFLAFE